MAKAGYTGEQPVRVAREESYPGAWTSPEQYTERKANTWSLSPVYEIERSLRFSSADSAFLSRTPASAGNRKTWTWAGWVKRSGTTTNWLPLFQVYDGSSLSDSNFLQLTIYLDQIGIATDSIWLRRTQAVYRDYSAWMHVVCAFDTTQATGSDRVKIYVNGSQVTAFAASSDPTQNTDYGINRAVSHQIGQRYGGQYFDGYLADIHFIDGQALTPTSFGKFDDNGVWQPKAYTGTYTGNSFHLDFADNSSVAALGDDTSGNNNDWTVNNIAVGSTIVGYSKDITFASGTYKGAEYPWLAFDNSLTTAVASSQDATTITWTPSTAITASSSFSILVYDYVGAAVTLNGSSLTQGAAGPAGTQAHYYNYSGSFPVTVSTVTVRTTGNAASRFYAVLVDGNFVIDPRHETGNDSLRDSPTNGDTANDTGLGGQVPGNYATLNPVWMSSGGTLSNGNLELISAGSYVVASSTIPLLEKTYWETPVPASLTFFLPGIIRIDSQPLTSGSYRIGLNATQYPNSATIWPDAQAVYYNGTSTYDTGNIWSPGDIIGHAFDPATGNYYGWRNGSPLNNGNPVATLSTSYTYAAALMTASPTYKAIINFGQRQWAYQAPAGFKALCTANLPTPTIEDGSTAMDVVTYTGNNSTQVISGLKLSPDLVWLKRRSGAAHHHLYDIVRGTTQRLQSSTTNLESTAVGGVTAFNSDGWTMGNDADINGSSNTFVAWTWDAGSSTVTNTSGSISSQVRANPSAGFSIVSYTGNGTSGATVGHGLNVAPSFYVCKFRNTNAADGPWYVYHKSLGATKTLTLNTTDAESTLSSAWNNTEPSSTFFSLGNAGDTNGSGRNFIAYCFAPVAGYSAFGSYTGNGSADGPFVYTGFRPKFVIQKQISAGTGGQWIMFDSARKTYNYQGPFLFAENSVAEGADAEYLDFLSNGFKFRTTNATLNGSGVVSIYIAFAEHPFQTARAR